MMARSSPKKMWVRHAQKPPKIIQMILSGMVIQPERLSPSLTSAPKGHRHKSPSLNVCTAAGMPIMVRASAKLPVK